MGGKQLGFSDYEQTTAKKRTKKEKFLAEMDQVVSWQPLIDLIEPYLSKSQQQRRPALIPIGNHAEDSPDAAVVQPQ